MKITSISLTLIALLGYFVSTILLIKDPIAHSTKQGIHIYNFFIWFTIPFIFWLIYYFDNLKMTIKKSEISNKTNEKNQFFRIPNSKIEVINFFDKEKESLKIEINKSLNELFKLEKLINTLKRSFEQKFIDLQTFNLENNKLLENKLQIYNRLSYCKKRLSVIIISYNELADLCELFNNRIITDYDYENKKYELIGEWINSTRIINYLIKYCIDYHKLQIITYSAEKSDILKSNNEFELNQFLKNKEIMLDLFNCLDIYPEHINFNNKKIDDDKLLEECIQYFISGDFINENNFLIQMIGEKNFIYTILKEFDEVFDFEEFKHFDSNESLINNDFFDKFTLDSIREFWNVFVKYQIVYFKYNKNGLGFDEWDNFGLKVYNDLIRAEDKNVVFDKLNKVLSSILQFKVITIK